MPSPLRARDGLSERLRVVSVEAREPDKAAYLAWREGGPRPAREAFCVLLDTGRRCGVEVVVSLDDDASSRRPTWTLAFSPRSTATSSSRWPTWCGPTRATSRRCGCAASTRPPRT